MPEQHPNLPNAVQAVFLILALFMLEFVIGVAMYGMRDVLGLTDMQQADLVNVLANGILFSVLMHHKNLSFAQLFHASRSSPKVTFILLLPPILLTIPAFVMLMGALSQILVDLFPLSSAEEQMFEAMAGTNLAATLATCVLAPMLEEMLFRGIILRSFLRQYPVWPAIFGSAALFGAAHLNLYQLVVAFALGTYCGWLYQRTRSLIPTITVHASYNSVLTLLTFFPQGKAASWFDGNSVGVWVLVLGLGWLGLLMLRRMLRQR
jgi:membrane protease YdiL (CAAX protease family)